MHEGLQSLTGREKQALRLLLRGHDAKSIAGELDLSVHTVNERLRDARRKLGVSSSREAARRLAEDECESPQNLGDKDLGDVGQGDVRASDRLAKRPPGAGHRLLWLSGGMLAMSLVIALVALSFAFHQVGAATPDARQEARPTNAVADAVDPAAATAARDWLALMDDHQWEASWRATSPVFQAKVSARQWAAMAQSVEQSVGRETSRVVESTTLSSSLPNLPPGEYTIIQYRTSFCHQPNALESVVLNHERDGWKVSGYWIH